MVIWMVIQLCSNPTNVFFLTCVLSFFQLDLSACFAGHLGHLDVHLDVHLGHLDANLD